MSKYLIPIDKANHFIVGSFIYLISSFFLSPIYSFIPVMIIGSLKETYDYISKKGTPDLVDLLYTIAGSLPLFITKIHN
jgi:hypothetical protein